MLMDGNPLVAAVFPSVLRQSCYEHMAVAKLSAVTCCLKTK